MRKRFNSACLVASETYLTDKNKVPNRAIGYLKSVKGELEDNNGFVELPNPDGGFQSTALDVMNFYREFFYGNKLLKEETKLEDEFFQLIQDHRTTGGAIPQAGGFNGANSCLLEVLRDKISIVVLANMDEPVAEQLASGILAFIRGKEAPIPSIPAVQLVYKTYLEKGVDFVEENFESLTINFHPEDPRSLILNRVGYEFFFDGQLENALEIFHLNTKLFADDPNVWDSLGEAYLKKGEKEMALKYYKKALSLDPELPSAVKAVKEIER